jgi:hypothetical protein
MKINKDVELIMLLGASLCIDICLDKKFNYKGMKEIQNRLDNRIGEIISGSGYADVLKIKEKFKREFIKK